MIDNSELFNKYNNLLHNRNNIEHVFVDDILYPLNNNNNDKILKKNIVLINNDLDIKEEFNNNNFLKVIDFKDKYAFIDHEENNNNYLIDLDQINLKYNNILNERFNEKKKKNYDNKIIINIFYELKKNIHNYNNYTNALNKIDIIIEIINSLTYQTEL